MITHQKLDSVTSIACIVKVRHNNDIGQCVGILRSHHLLMAQTTQVFLHHRTHTSKKKERKKRIYKQSVCSSTADISSNANAFESYLQKLSLKSNIFLCCSFVHKADFASRRRHRKYNVDWCKRSLLKQGLIVLCQVSL